MLLLLLLLFLLLLLPIVRSMIAAALPVAYLALGPFPLVPGMYTHEELEPLLSPLRELMREEGGSMGDSRQCLIFIIAAIL